VLVARGLPTAAPVQILNQFSPDIRQDTHVEVRVEIELQQKNDLCFDLSGLLENLAEDAVDQAAGAAELERLTKALAEAQAALKKLEDAKDPKARENRGPLARLKGFMEGVIDAESTLGKLVASLDNGPQTARKAIDLYNRLAPLLGGPPIPNPFGKGPGAGGTPGP
jgi:hypothetical protein